MSDPNTKQSTDGHTVDGARYNLRIHFAPATACVDISLSKTQHAEIMDAAEKHRGAITFEVSASRRLKVQPDAPWLDER